MEEKFLEASNEYQRKCRQGWDFAYIVESLLRKDNFKLKGIYLDKDGVTCEFDTFSYMYCKIIQTNYGITAFVADSETYYADEDIYWISEYIDYDGDTIKFLKSIGEFDDKCWKRFYEIKAIQD